MPAVARTSCQRIASLHGGKSGRIGIYPGALLRLIRVGRIKDTFGWIHELDNLACVRTLQYSAKRKLVIIDEICLDIAHCIIRGSFEHVESVRGRLYLSQRYQRGSILLFTVKTPCLNDSSGSDDRCKRNYFPRSILLGLRPLASPR